MKQTVKERVRIKTSSKFNELYRGLNDGQRQAVDTVEGPVMVVAGPGTGKTQVLAVRIANILRVTQMGPENILCLTFTESAAHEMRRRLIEIIGEAAYRVRVETFHSFCNGVIQDWPDKFAGSAEWRPLADIERINVYKEVIDGLEADSVLRPFGSPYLFLRDCVEGVKKLKQEGVGTERYREVVDLAEIYLGRLAVELDEFFTVAAGERTDRVCHELYSRLQAVAKELGAGSESLAIENIFLRYFEQVEGQDKREASKYRTKLKNDVKRVLAAKLRQLPKQKEMIRVYESYQKKLLAMGRYDYEDMVVQVVERFKSDEELLAHYQEQFQYIVVDEFQDTNGAQNEAVRLLGGFYPNPNVFVVGDDKQSIFRFQGASMDNMVEFYSQYKEYVKVISLVENYRSQPVILRAAYEVIRKNEERIEKYMPVEGKEWEAKGGGSEKLIQVSEAETPEHEDEYVAGRVKELIEGGCQPAEIAVLYRLNRDADDLLTAMERVGVPCRLETGDDVLNERRVKQLFKLMEYVVGGRDEVLVEVLQYDWWDFDPLDVMKVIRLAGRREGLFEVMTDRKKLEGAGVADKEALVDFMKKVARWRVGEKNETLQKFFSVVMSESGWLQKVVEEDKDLVSLSGIKAIFSEVRKAESGGAEMTLADLVGYLQTMCENGLPLTAGRGGGEQAVRLMTAHKSKGLEFDHVFVIGLTRGHWGNRRSLSRLSLPTGIVSFDPVWEDSNDEDERRLFFVAVTRARKTVELSWARCDDGGREKVPAVFLQEIPEGLKQDRRIDLVVEEEVTRIKREVEAGSSEWKSDQVRSWLSDQLDGYVMSVTHLNNYLECPLIFYYRNLLRVPMVKTKHMVLGTAVHGSLRDFLMKYKEDKRLPSKRYLLSRFKKWLAVEAVGNKENWPGVLVAGRKFLGEYFDNYKDSFRREVLTEYDFRRQGIYVDDLRLTGRLDLVEIGGEGKKVNVVDYKTGNPDGAYKYLGEGGKYRRQLVFYKLLGDRSHQFDYEIISGTIDFVQPSRRTSKYVRRRFMVSKSEVEGLEEEIRRVWNEIRSLSFLEEKNWCGECEYCLNRL